MKVEYSTVRWATGIRTALLKDKVAAGGGMQLPVIKARQVHKCLDKHNIENVREIRA